MDCKELMQFLTKQKLFDVVKENAYYFKRVFKQCLDAKPDDEILLVSDLGEGKKSVAAMVAGAYCLAAQSLDLDLKTILQKNPNPRLADERVVEALGSMPKGSIVLMSLTNKLGSLKEGEKSYRKLVKARGYKFTSSTSLGGLPNKHFESFVKAVDIDYTDLQMRMQAVKEKLDAGTDVNVTTPAGTDVNLRIKHHGAISVSGDYTKEGSGGNIPVGEVYLAPDKKKVEGTIVIDGSMRNDRGTKLIKTPIKMTVEDGSVVDISGGKEAELLDKSLQAAEKRAKYPWGIRRVGELGIGMNPGAKIIGSTLIDEKTLDTCHFALGSNYWFGGTIKAIIHYDQVLKNPKITIDGEELKI